MNALTKCSNLLWRIPRKFRTLWKMPMPHGLFSLSLYVRHNDQYSKIHREISLSQRGKIPSVLWFLVEYFLALSWRWRFASSETNKAVNRFAATVEAKEGVPALQQQRIVLDLSKRFCIHPLSIYRYRLYRDPQNALKFIFPREVKPLHRLRNGDARHPDRLAIQDKLQFASRSGGALLPVVEVVQHLRRHECIGSSDIRFGGSDGVFIKSRSGFRGIGAFSLLRDGDNRLGHSLGDGRVLNCDSEIDAAISKILVSDDAIVQPLLTNHELFAKVTPPNQSTILRVVTVFNEAHPYIYSAYLRIPIKSASGVQGAAVGNGIEVLAGVELQSGCITRNVDSSISLNPEWARIEEGVIAGLGDSPTIPFWNEIVKNSIAAQHEYSGLWAIGWDWFITDEKAYLLEGNVHWGTNKPQEISGGLFEELSNLSNQRRAIGNQDKPNLV